MGVRSTLYRVEPELLFEATGRACRVGKEIGRATFGVPDWGHEAEDYERRPGSAVRLAEMLSRTHNSVWERRYNAAVFSPWDHRIHDGALETAELQKTWNDLLIAFDPEEWVGESRPESGTPPVLARSVLGTHLFPPALDRTFDSAFHPRFNLPIDVAVIASALEDAHLDALITRAEGVAELLGVATKWFMPKWLPRAFEDVRGVYTRAADDGSVVVCCID
ncbi:hypothetical protein [Rubrivirga sp.]|uniref:hypothetical protein n=1 Tax=Rubrivirga sp. TaxID=1885344 RepID=UPI003C77BA07